VGGLSVIFDFDGTIADSLPVVSELFYEWAKIEPFSPEQIERLRNTALKDALKEVGIPLWRLPSLMVTARSKFGKRIADVPIFKGIPDILGQLHSDGYTLYLMSSNGPQNIRRFLRRHKIIQYFSGIHGNTGLFGKSAAIRTIIRKYKLDLPSCISIGDETRDVDAAKKARIKCVAVTWGYNGEKILREHKPDFMVHQPLELLKLLQ